MLQCRKLFVFQPRLAGFDASVGISICEVPQDSHRFISDQSSRQGSVSVTDRGHSATVSTQPVVRETVCQAIFLGKFLILALCINAKFLL